MPKGASPSREKHRLSTPQLLLRQSMAHRSVSVHSRMPSPIILPSLASSDLNYGCCLNQKSLVSLSTSLVRRGEHDDDGTYLGS